MATIDTLWDEPIESEPAPHLAKNPVTPSEDPLFLQSDSDNELGGRTDAAGSRPSKAPEDIGALFDVDDDEENGQLSNVTYEQLRKDALSGGKVADDGSSSGGAEDAHSKGPSTDKFKADKKDEDGNAASTKRKIPKLDEELLLSEKGIPALIKDAKRWQPKGKGHEVCYAFRLRQWTFLFIGRDVRFRTSIVSFGCTNIGLIKCTLAIPLTTLSRESKG